MPKSSCTCSRRRLCPRLLPVGVCIALCVWTAHAAEVVDGRAIRARHLTVDNGLANDNVRVIFQDRLGFIWLGTWAGLHRYDGYGFRIYQNEPENPFSLSNNIVSFIHEDPQGRLWVGTVGGGLNRYDPRTEQFFHYQHDPKRPDSLSNDIIVSILEGKESTLWIGSWGGGLEQFDPASGKVVQRLRFDEKNPESLSGDYVTGIFRDSKNRLWVMTRSSGLNRVLPGENRVRRYPLSEKSPGCGWGQNLFVQEDDETIWFVTHHILYRFKPALDQLYEFHIWDGETFLKTILRDHAGKIWIAAEGKNGGVYRVEQESNRLVYYQDDPKDPYSLGGKMCIAMGEDRSGLLWVGFYGGGVSRFPAQENPFHLYRHDPDDPNTINDDRVFCTYEDTNGAIWIGTRAGLDRFNRLTGKITRYSPQVSAKDDSRATRHWNTIYEDRRGNLWISSAFAHEGAGLILFDRERGVVTREYRHEANNPESLSHNAVMDIHEDSSGRLWVATDRGLNLFERDKESFTAYLPDANNISSPENNIRCIWEDTDGTLWLGSWYGGLRKFDPRTGKFVTFAHNPKDSTSLSDNTVYDLLRDPKGRLWIATANGLDLMDEQTGEFLRYSTRHGFRTNSIYSILRDNNGFLWLGTANGIARFDPEKESVVIYDDKHGLQGKSYQEVTPCKTRSGLLVFGGTKGFNIFDPTKITKHQFVPPVVLTDFQLSYKTVPVDLNSVLKQPIWLTNHIELPYYEKIISFEFCALSFYDPARNSYAFKMEGLENKWNYVDSTRRFVTYTRLPPGEYTFRVKAANHDGIWNDEGISLGITVSVPWWKTWWAYGGYGAMGLVCLYLVIAWRVAVLREHQRRLVNQVDQRKAEIKKVLDEMIARERSITECATKTATDLRTMLQHILKSSNVLLADSSVSDDRRGNAEHIYKNAQALMETVDDVVDVLYLEYERGIAVENICDMKTLMDMLQACLPACATLNSELAWGTDEALPRFVQVDSRKLWLMLVKLLRESQISNDVKILIGIRYDIEQKAVHIEIRSVALNESAYERIRGGGPGIRLLLCRRLAESMGGELTVERTVEQELVLMADIPAMQASPSEKEGKQRIVRLEEGQTGPKVLVVEDVKELRLGLAWALRSAQLEVLTAENGQEALHVWQEVRPDAILMDLHLPFVNGAEATRRIKSESKEKTPIIIAMGSGYLEEDRLAAIQSGCDVFLSKPIDETEVLNALGTCLGLEFDWEDKGSDSY